MNLKTIKTYIIAFTLTNVILVYILNLPGLITNANNLVNEYYYKNGIYNYFFDLFIVGIYLLIANYISSLLKTNNYKTIIVLLTTILISSSFMIGFLSYPQNNTFFSRWFYKTKYNAVIYDAIIVTSIYLSYKYLYKYIN